MAGFEGEYKGVARSVRAVFCQRERRMHWIGLDVEVGPQVPGFDPRQVQFVACPGVEREAGSHTPLVLRVKVGRTACDFSGVPRLEIYDPPTGMPDGTGRQRFANNQITAGRIQTISRGLVALACSSS